MAARVLIVIPTYNERENIGPLLEAIREIAPEVDILFVDDDSPDGTGEELETFSRADRHLFVLHREKKLGLGPAYVAGFRWALARDYALVLQMDADFSHQPRELPRLLEAADHADLVLGSRYMAGGGVENWPLRRRLLSRIGNLYVRLVLGVRFGDLTGGYKCWRRETLEALDLDAIRHRGYGFQIELTYRTFCTGFRIVEVPIVFADRTRGHSKIESRTIVEALLGMIALRGSIPRRESLDRKISR
jgi:dolichol-phosphate mannosyltransferase